MIDLGARALEILVPEASGMNPSFAAGIAILSAVATLGGGILTGALILWRFSTMLATMRATSESGHKETATALRTLAEQTATALRTLADQTERSISALRESLGAQIKELKDDRKDHADDIGRLQRDVERLDDNVKRIWLVIERHEPVHEQVTTLEAEMKHIKERMGSLSRITAQKG